MDFYWCFLLLRKGKDFLVHAIDVYFLSFLSSAPDGGQWSALCIRRFTPIPPQKRTPMSIELKAGLVPKDGLDGLKKRKRQDRKP
jgi:hypothetical protein